MSDNPYPNRRAQQGAGRIRSVVCEYRAAAEDSGAHARLRHDARVPGLCRLRAGGAGAEAARGAHHALGQLVQLP